MLIKLYNEAFYNDFLKYGSCPAYGRTIENMKSSIKKYPKEIIFFNNSPIGVISSSNNGGGNYYIGCLCIIPKYQNKGIGSKAIKHFCKTHNDCLSIEIITPADKYENICFYEKNGFEIIRTEQDDTVKVVRMKKIL